MAHGVDRIRVPADSGVVGWVASKGESLIVEDAYSDPRFNPEVDREAGYRTKTILAVPCSTRRGTSSTITRGGTELDTLTVRGVRR